MADLFDLIAHDVFIADGGVDDFREMDNEELKRHIQRHMFFLANDDESLSAIVSSARRLEV